MAGVSSLASSLCNEKETEQLVQQMLSLWERGMHGSTVILGELLLSNQRALGLLLHPDWHLSVLLAYADGLFEDQQHRRALHYYKESAKTLAQAQHTGGKGTEKLPNELDVKWKIYRCHVILRQHQEALDTLSSISLRLRNVQVAIALGKLYKDFKNDSRCAIICYRQALSMCPYAMEAVLGLLSLGMTLSEIHTLTSVKSTPHSPPITSSHWVTGWLKVQEEISKCDYDSAITGFEKLTKAGFCLGPSANCRLAWCLGKVEKRAAALELFSTAQTQDPYVLTHMDTYARLLTNTKRLEKLSSSLVAASDSHSECWVAKAWYQTRNTALSSLERSRASVLLQNAYSYSLKNAEATFCHASLFWAKQEIHSAVQKYQEAVHIDPSFFEAYEALVRCYLVMRRDREAINLARAASQHIKKPALQFYLQGIALSQRPSTTDKCRVLLEKSVKADPTFQQAILQLGGLYIREGALTNTVDLLQKHIDTCNTPLLHSELGNCLTRLKRYQEAMDHYSLALIQDPTFDKALHGMELLQQQLQSTEDQDNGVDRVGVGDEVEEEDSMLGVRPLELDNPALDLENPLEMDSDEDALRIMGLPNHDYQW